MVKYITRWQRVILFLTVFEHGSLSFIYERRICTMRKRRQRWQPYAYSSNGTYSLRGSGQSTGNGGGNTSAGGNAGSGSSTQAEESDKNAIKDLVTYEAPNREQEGFFILNTEGS